MLPHCRTASEGWRLLLKRLPVVSSQMLVRVCNCLGLDPERMHLALELQEVPVSKLSSLLTLHDHCKALVLLRPLLLQPLI